MANIASNTYLFYGDKAELVKCHDALNKLYETVGSRDYCAEKDENDVVNCEWIEYIEELNGSSDSFGMVTTSKWYGNPTYWHDWAKTNFPNLSVAFRCEEPGMGIFETVDPDNRLDDCVYISGSFIPEGDMEKLSQVIKDEMCGDCVYHTFIRDEVFNSEYQPSDLPNSVSCEEYTNTTYDDIRASNEAYIRYVANLRENNGQKAN